MKLYKYIILSLFLILCSCDEQSTTYYGGQGNINGTVYNFENDVTLEGCTITLFPTVGSDRSNSFGNFKFYSIETGEYAIKVEKIGFRDYDGKVIVYDDETTTLSIVLKTQ